MCLKLEAHIRLSAQPISMRGSIPDADGNNVCRRIQQLVGTLDLGSVGDYNMRWKRLLGSIVFAMYHKGTVVGYALVKKTDSDFPPRVKHYVSNAYVVPSMRGRGINKILHQGVLHALKSVASDYDLSIGEVNTWRALSKAGHSVKLWCADQRKQVAFSWDSRGIPVVSGKPIDQLNDIFMFYI